MTTRAASRRGRDEAAGLASLAGVLADETRASFCVALLDGRAWTARELAAHAGVAPSTATEHLHKLVAAGLLAEERQGRHRYVRLAGPEAAELIEALSSTVAHPPPPTSLAAASRQRRMTYARTCYDHLAGVVGVALADALVDRGFVTWHGGLALTDPGVDWLTGLGVSTAPVGRRPVLRSCLDWTQRRPHLAGSVGAAICRYAFDAGWVVRIGTARAVRVTDAGRDAFREHLGLSLEPAPVA